FAGEKMRCEFTFEYLKESGLRKRGSLSSDSVGMSQATSSESIYNPLPATGSAYEHGHASGRPPAVPPPRNFGASTIPHVMSIGELGAMDGGLVGSPESLNASMLGYEIMHGNNAVQAGSPRDIRAGM